MVWADYVCVCGGGDEREVFLPHSFPSSFIRVFPFGIEKFGMNAGRVVWRV